MANTAGAVPAGAIGWYSGASIPTGLQLPDGTNGTPNLAGKFVIGAGNDYAVNATGGALTHTHTYTWGGSIVINGGGSILAGAGWVTNYTINFPSHTSPSASHLSPYVVSNFAYHLVTGGVAAEETVGWNGLISDIPAGFSLADGGTYNGVTTPDYRDRMLVCTGGSFSLGSTGGAYQHNHVITNDYSGYIMFAGGGGLANVGGTSGYVAGGPYSASTLLNTARNLPPYFAKAFITNTSGMTLGTYTGMIFMWSGSIASIPTGWTLSNDLKDRFPVGGKQDSGGVVKTNISTALTQSGGFTEQTNLNNTMHGISGSITGYLDTPPKNGVQGTGGTLGSTLAGGGGGAPVGATNMPPYYSLAYITKS